MKKYLCKINDISLKEHNNGQIPREDNKIKKENELMLGLNHRQRKAIEYIKKYQTIKRQEYIELNRVSHTTASKELKELLEKGVLKTISAGKWLRYKLT